MPEIVGLDHVQIAMPVGSEDRARAFYGGLLGLVEVQKPTALEGRGGCWFVGYGEASRFALHLGAEADFQPARKAHVALLVNDLTDIRAILTDAGVTTVDDESLLAIRRFYAWDPFGNRLEFVDRRDAGFTERPIDA